MARYRLTPVIALVALAIIGSMLAVGTVHVAVLLCVAPVAIAAGAWAVGRVGRGVGAIPPPAWIAFALSGYSALQAVPIPASVLRAVSPVAAEIWTRALQPLGAPSTWLSISLDPGASVVEALKWFCYGSMFCAGAAIASGQSRRVVPSIIFGSAFLAALLALTNRLISAESLFGLYTPYLHSSFGITPLININNFSGYLNLGAFAGLGLLMSRRAVAPRWAIGLAVSVVVGLSAVCGSRAGLASLAFGMLILVAALWVFKLEGSRRLLWVPVGALVGGIVLFCLAVSAGLWQSMIREGTLKLALISWTKPVVRDFPLLGIGRGAFETVFPAYRADTGHHLYQFAENFVMQWCVEWGLPVALAALVGFAYTLRPRRIGARSEVLALCCGIGVLVLLAQNLLDLALEVPSVTLALSALLGSSWSQVREARFDTEAPPALSARLPVGAFFGLGVVLWTVSAFVGNHTALDEREMIAQLIRSNAKRDVAATNELGTALTLAMRRHPADPYFPLIAATLTRATSGAELAWISRAVERDPMAGRPYLLLAQALARRKAKRQALQAVRLAVEREYGLIGPGVTLAVRMTHDVDELKRTVPDGKAGVGTLVYLSRIAELQHFHDSLLMQAIGRDPSALEPRLLRAEDLLTALESKGVSCEEPRHAACTLELRALVQAIARIEPKSDRPLVFSARLLLVEGNPRAAERLLAEKCKTLEMQTACARLRFSVAEQLDDHTVLQDAMASLLGDSCSTPVECSATATWLGQRLAAKGDPVGALHMYERAARESESPQAWQRVADVANSLGLPSLAARALRRTGREGGEPAATAFPRTLEEKRLRELSNSVLDGGIH
ncbi:MAG: O-antigen ligase family protein [Polyangiaceae bacterium]